MSDKDSDTFIDFFNKTVTAMHAFNEGNLQQADLITLSKTFADQSNTPAARDTAFREGFNDSQTNAFLGLVHLAVTLDDTSQLLKGFMAFYPDKAVHIKHVDLMLNQALNSTDELLTHLKDEHHEYLIAHDLPCGQSTVEDAWDMYCDYTTRVFALDKNYAPENLVKLQRQCSTLSDAYQTLAGIYTKTAQMKLGYFHQCVTNEREPDLPIPQLNVSAMPREERHRLMKEFAEIDLSSAMQVVGESNTIMIAMGNMVRMGFIQEPPRPGQVPSFSNGISPMKKGGPKPPVYH